MAVALVATVGVIAVPAAASATAGAVVRAANVVTPGTHTAVSVTAVPCAGARVSLRQRFATTHGAAVWRAVATRTASASGRASFTAGVPTSAAKTAQAMPMYWLASSTSTSCEAALSTVAARSTIAPYGKALVTVSGTRGHYRLVVTGCRGGVADAYVVDSVLTSSPVVGLRVSGSGTLSVPLTVPMSAVALFLDCVQSKVASYTGHGITLPGSKSITADNHDGSGLSMSATDTALWAVAPCQPGGGFYRWPMICGTSSPGVAAMESLRRSTVVRTEEQRLLGSDLMTPKLTGIEDLVLEHPQPVALSPGLHEDAANENNTTTTSSHTTASDGTTVTNTYSYDNGSTAVGVGATEIVAGTLRRDAARKQGYLSFTTTVTTSQKTAFQGCPDAEGDLSLALELTTKIEWKGVRTSGLKVQGSVSEHVAVKATPRVNDSARWESFELAGAAEVVVHNVAPPGGDRDDHASYDQHHSMSKGQDIPDSVINSIVSDAAGWRRSFSSYAQDGSRAGNTATAYLGGAVALGAVVDGEAADSSVYSFYNQAGCFTVTFDGDKSVPPGATHPFTVKVIPKAGGALSSKVVFTGTDGTIDPTQLTVHNGDSLPFSYTAPAASGKTAATWTLEGVSKRGRIHDSIEFTLSGQYKLEVGADITPDTGDCCHTTGGWTLASEVVLNPTDNPDVFAGTGTINYTRADQDVTESHEDTTDDPILFPPFDESGCGPLLGGCPVPDCQENIDTVDSGSQPGAVDAVMTVKRDEHGVVDGVQALSYDLHDFGEETMTHAHLSGTCTYGDGTQQRTETSSGGQWAQTTWLYELQTNAVQQAQGLLYPGVTRTAFQQGSDPVLGRTDNNYADTSGYGTLHETLTINKSS